MYVNGIKSIIIFSGEGNLCKFKLKSYAEAKRNIIFL